MGETFSVERRKLKPGSQHVFYVSLPRLAGTITWRSGLVRSALGSVVTVVLPIVVLLVSPCIPTPVPRPLNVPLLRALWYLLDGIWGLLKGSWGVLVPPGFRCDQGSVDRV